MTSQEVDIQTSRDAQSDYMITIWCAAFMSWSLKVDFIVSMS